MYLCVRGDFGVQENFFPNPACIKLVQNKPNRVGQNLALTMLKTNGRGEKYGATGSRGYKKTRPMRAGFRFTY
jgi:hypothetical protein